MSVRFFLSDLRLAVAGALLLASSTLAQAQVYVPPSAPYPGSAQAATSQVYHYFNGVPYYHSFYYPGPEGTYPTPLDFRTELGFNVPPLIIISPSISDTTVSAPVTVPPPAEPQPATLDVHLPAGATLYISGYKTKQTGSDRYFVTPPLAEGQTFRYTLKAAWSEDGRRKAVERQVVVHGGEQALIRLDDAQTE
jgi:uncharacterized protein (TIGR03000 family)